jgi:hypothetical protein
MWRLRVAIPGQLLDGWCTHVLLGLLTRRPRIRMVNYAKWDNLDVDDDDPPPRPKAVPQDPQAHHGQSMQLIAEWIREAYPRLNEEELAQLMKFVALQHPGIHPDNIMRHAGIAAFFDEAAAAGKLPSLHALLALGQLAKERSQSSDAEEAGRGGRILLVASQAINTLVACQSEGSARQFFDTMLREPNGELVARYRALGFATACLQDPPPDPRDAPPPEPSWCYKLWRGVAMQLAAMSVVGILMHFAMPDPSLFLPMEQDALQRIGGEAHEAPSSVAGGVEA